MRLQGSIQVKMACFKRYRCTCGHCDDIRESDSAFARKKPNIIQEGIMENIDTINEELFDT